MKLPFRRSATPAEFALSSYWDDLAHDQRSSDVLAINVDPDLAGTVRQLDRFAATAMPRADFADRMLDDLLGRHREELAVHIASPASQTGARPRFSVKSLTLPDVRQGLSYASAAAIMVVLIGTVAFVLSRQSGPDPTPSVIPAIAQDGSATPDSSPSSTPAALINPDSIETLWQWDLPTEHNQNDGYDQYLRVAVSADGVIYAIDPDADGDIHILDESGTQTGTWGGPGEEPGTFNFGLSSSQVPLPGGDIGFDTDGNIYVFDSGNDRIQKFSPDRQFVTEWPIEGNENIDYNKPLGAVDPVNGKVYVVTALYPKVQVFDLEGNLLTSWGEFGGKEGQFRAPSDVAVAPDGTVWISDSGISRIQHFDADGNFLGMIGGERGGEPGQFNQVTGLFIDANDNIFVADFGNGRIQVVRPDGTPLLVFNLTDGTDRIAGAFSLWVDEEGSLYVGDSFDDRILKLKLPPLSAGSEPPPAASPAAMVNPDDIESVWQWDLVNSGNLQVDKFLRVAVGPSGEIYANDTANSIIHLLDVSGTETGTWGTPGTGPGEFDFGNSNNSWVGGDIDFDATGNIYVFDSTHDRIQKFSPDRQFIKEWSTDSEGSADHDFDFPVGAVDPVSERVYVVTEAFPKVQVFDLEGNLLLTWGSFGSGEGQFRKPSDVAIAPDGTIWISDLGISRLQHFDAEGNYLGVMGGERGGQPGQFNQVSGLFIDDHYNIFVADFGNGRIQVVRPDGTPLLVFNLTDGTDRIAGAFSLWVDEEGSLYVGDSFDDRILKLHLPPLT